MKGTIFERRRAERFAELLEEADGGRRRHGRREADDELAPMVALGRRVAAIPTPTAPDEEFRIGLRAMLMATAERDGIGATDRGDEKGGVLALAEAPEQRSRARAAVLVGITAGALALSGVSAASGDAMPGDTLYGIKRSSERAQLALAGSDTSRGALYLEFARTRLGEAGRVGPDRVPAVLADMDQQTREGVRLLTTAALDRKDQGALAAVETFVKRQREGLATLTPGLDRAGTLRAAESGNLLSEVGERATAIRRALACGVGGSKLDSLGPQVKDCPTGRPADNGAKPVKTPGSGTRPGIGPATEPPTGEDRQPTSGPIHVTEGPAVATTGPSVQVPVVPDDDGGLLDDLGEVLGDLLG